MKKVVWTLCVLALTSNMALAQDVNEPVPAPMPAYTMENPLDKALIANEHKVNEAVAKGDKVTFASLVSLDGWAVDMTGVMKIADFVPMFDQVKVTSWKLSDEKVTWVDANTAIVLSTWTGTGTFQGVKLPSPVYASTVWTKKADKWIAVFHQETEAAKPPPKK